jgi:hypothetical protein
MSAQETHHAEMAPVMTTERVAPPMTAQPLGQLQHAMQVSPFIFYIDPEASLGQSHLSVEDRVLPFRDLRFVPCFQCRRGVYL